MAPAASSKSLASSRLSVGKVPVSTKVLPARKRQCLDHSNECLPLWIGLQLYDKGFQSRSSSSCINWIFCQNGVNIVAGGWSMTAQEVLELIQRAKDERARKLDLSKKNLTEIPPEIADLTSLQLLTWHGTLFLNLDERKFKWLDTCWLSSPSTFSSHHSLTFYYPNQWLPSLPPRMRSLPYGSLQSVSAPT